MTGSFCPSDSSSDAIPAWFFGPWVELLSIEPWWLSAVSVFSMTLTDRSAAGQVPSSLRKTVLNQCVAGDSLLKLGQIVSQVTRKVD